MMDNPDYASLYFTAKVYGKRPEVLYSQYDPQGMIDKRNLQILALYEHGMSLQTLANAYKLSAQRVHQIVAE